MPVITIDTMSAAGAVRIRASAVDPHAGLRGHAYIAARGLARPVERIDPHATHRAEATLRLLTRERRPA